MTKTPILLLLLLPVLFTRCTYHAYYQSPFHASTETYHTQPLVSDSLPSATYASGVLTTGGANQNWRDPVTSFTASVYRTNRFGQFQVYYGADAALGAYSVHRYPGGDRQAGMDTTAVNDRAGNKTFGGYGVSGGINLVLPFGRGSELRFPGISFSLRQEFGDYLRFRKGLPDSAANTIFRKSLTGMLGVSLEAAFKTRFGMIGYKVQGGGNTLYPAYAYSGDYTGDYRMWFLSQSLSITVKQVTGYSQINIGNHVGNLQLGVIYRLGPHGRQ